MHLLTLGQTKESDVLTTSHCHPSAPETRLPIQCPLSPSVLLMRFTYLMFSSYHKNEIQFLQDPSSNLQFPASLSYSNRTTTPSCWGNSTLSPLAITLPTSQTLCSLQSPHDPVWYVVPSSHQLWIYD